MTRTSGGLEDLLLNNKLQQNGAYLIKYLSNTLRTIDL